VFALFGAEIKECHQTAEQSSTQHHDRHYQWIWYMGLENARCYGQNDRGYAETIKHHFVFFGFYIVCFDRFIYFIFPFLYQIVRFMTPEGLISRNIDA
tara:strand:- start:197 stop:490 length:294 start_codon:yes stop_codon:yes gene_type:complete